MRTLGEEHREPQMMQEPFVLFFFRSSIKPVMGDTDCTKDGFMLFLSPVRVLRICMLNKVFQFLPLSGEAPGGWISEVQ